MILHLSLPFLRSFMYPQSKLFPSVLQKRSQRNPDKENLIMTLLDADRDFNSVPNYFT